MAQRSRRDLLLGLAGLTGIATGWQVWISRTRSFEFEAIEGLPGWRRAQLEGVSFGAGGASGAVFMGIGGDDAPEPLPPEALCSALYQSDAGGIPVAVFTDFFCPNCRRFDPLIAARADDLGLGITWHEWPLFGAASEMAARAALAAERQGGFADMQARLLATPFRPSPAFLRKLAQDAGLDGERLLADMESPEVAARLLQTRRLVETLGLIGTPALAVGKTVVQGVLTEAQLSSLIDQSGAC